MRGFFYDHLISLLMLKDAATKRMAAKQRFKASPDVKNVRAAANDESTVSLLALSLA